MDVKKELKSMGKYNGYLGHVFILLGLILATW
ncbi:MAG: hypothetical protein FD145_1365 [Candidatus Saganbacteria bacterium]|uniref:Uncharacterized protein n=1 Tax=Candidatus Saganbacteria bacterium TaxID=2575572 RepID=A0A833L0A3_UNCSA|nr:MAG: hypothetical protein FD145_1365 [Candidatus Saganbacteria bacterium]